MYFSENPYNKICEFRQKIKDIQKEEDEAHSELYKELNTLREQYSTPHAEAVESLKDKLFKCFESKTKYDSGTQIYALYYILGINPEEYSYICEVCKMVKTDYTLSADIVIESVNDSFKSYGDSQVITEISIYEYLSKKEAFKEKMSKLIAY